MCGIAGWIDFSASASRVAPGPMAATLAHRGPDSADVWQSRDVGLGHRRLAIIDPDGGAQPMCHDTGHGDVVVIYNGEVFNYRELRSTLTASGHRFIGDSDTETVLRAYLQWGDAMVDRLEGMFAFALWDGRRDRLLLARDGLGIKPLFYYLLPSGAVFGSEPKALFAHPAVQPVVDGSGRRELFNPVRTPGHAIFRGMSELEPGHLLAVDRTGAKKSRYWRLGVHEHRDDLPTTIRTVRSLLETAVTSQLVADVPLCSLLSGGLDSSVVTAIAARDLAARGRPALRTFAVDIDSGRLSRIPPDLMRSSLDRSFADEVAGILGTRHMTIEVDTPALLKPDARQAARRARDLPSLGEIDVSLLLLFEAVRDHATVVLSGEGADELFGGYAWFHAMPALDQPAFPWVAMARTLGRYSMFEPAVANLDMVGYQADLYADAVRNAPHLASDTAVERRMRLVSYLHLSRFLPTPLERKDRMSMAASLEVRVPFCDRRLVEYVFNVPWSMKTFDGHEKSLLRAAAHDLLPPSITGRPKNAYPSTRDPAYHAALRDEVNVLLAEGTAPVLDLLARPLARALAAMPATGAPAVLMQLERIVNLNSWLDDYRVSLTA